MGGRIWAESPGEGRGATFCFVTEHAPAPPEASTPHASPALASRDLARLRVLVAEDNPVNQAVAVGFLRRLGVEVEVVSDGVAALEHLERHPADVVLMDMQMPRLDGVGAARRIRSELPSDRHPVIVALTANAFRDDEEACLEAGMQVFLRKPLQSSELRRVLGTVLTAREANGAGQAAVPVGMVGA